MVAHLRAIKIEISIRLITDLASKRHNWRNFPVEASASPNLAIRQNRVVELRDPIRGSEIVIYTVTGLLQIRPQVKGHVLVHLELEARCWQDGVQQPLRGDFPAKSGGGNNRVFSLDIDAHAQYELQVGTVNISAPNE